MPTKYKPAKRNWIVFAPLRTVVVAASDEDDAKAHVLRMGGTVDLSSKPYLARDWTVRLATEDEVKRYARLADFSKPPQTPEDVRKHPRKPTQARLV